MTMGQIFTQGQPSGRLGICLLKNCPGGEGKLAAGSREGGQVVRLNPFVWGEDKGSTRTTGVINVNL